MAYSGPKLPGPGNLQKKLNQIIDIYHVPSGRSVQFGAAIINFNDSFTSDWNQTEVYGRMDPIGTFKRTRRQIALSFQVMAEDIEEAKDNLRKMSLLSQMHYPAFDLLEEQGGIEQTPVIRGGPLWKLRFLNWIGNGNPGYKAQSGGLLGWSGGVNFNPDANMGAFQEGTQLYPKKFDINFTFMVLHEQQLGWNYVERSATPEGGATTLDATQPSFPYGVKNGQSEKQRTAGNDLPTAVQEDVTNQILRTAGYKEEFEKGNYGPPNLNKYNYNE